MKKQLIFIVLFFMILGVKAQYSFQQWHKGILVTTDKDTLRGDLQYNMETNTVTVAINDNVRAFSSHNILYFEIFDSVLQHYRQFYTIPYRLKADYKTPVIFELLYEGSLSLLAREKVVQEAAAAGSFGYGGPRIVKDVIDYDYYFLSKDGQMTFYTESKIDLFRILADKREEIRSFMKENRLKHDMMRDLIRITSFYNSI